MALWLVRAGKSGQQEDVALGKGLAVIGWEQLPDLSQLQSKEELQELYSKVYPDEKLKTVINRVGQIWTFRDKIQVDDLVALPLKKQSAIALGKVTGPYQYRANSSDGVRHAHTVKWIRKDIPRSAVDQDLLYSLGAAQTVARIQRNQAEERIRAIIEGKSGPPPPGGPDGEGEGDPTPDLEEFARDQIRNHLGQNFKGHELARLVTELLKAQGYQTQMAPPGADGGVDVIAGKGSLGFDPPRLCVQVKSGDQPVDVKPLRELRGVLPSFGANQGLLVSWGGFKQSTLKEARSHYFEVRLWDADDLLDAVLEQYNRLPEELRAELPLKRIWTLVPEE